MEHINTISLFFLFLRSLLSLYLSVSPPPQMLLNFTTCNFSEFVLKHTPGYSKKQPILAVFLSFFAMLYLLAIIMKHLWASLNILALIMLSLE